MVKKKTLESLDLFAPLEGQELTEDNQDFTQVSKLVSLTNPQKLEGKSKVKSKIKTQDLQASQALSEGVKDNLNEDLNNLSFEDQGPSFKEQGKKTSRKVTFKPTSFDYIYPVDKSLYLVCGADEAGRGPLMGNVVAACVLLDPKNPILGLNDSKKLTEKKREALEIEIKEKALAFGIGKCSPEEIDNLNILHAALEAMRRAYFAMGVECNLLLVDGNKVPPNLPLACEAVVKGDAKVEEIAAASILAKVERDRELYELDKLYPQYGFAKHKGYPTKAHLEALEHLPILPCYRKSYRPVRELLKRREADHAL